MKKIKIKVIKEQDADSAEENLEQAVMAQFNKLTDAEQDELFQKESVLVDKHFKLYEALQDAIDEDGGQPCPQCLYEVLSDASCGCPDLIPEAEYRGNKVDLNSPKRGGSKKFYVYVTGCLKDKKKVKKISFGDPNMKIKKSNPKRRKSFRARHKCKQKKNKCTAGYWSCKKW